MLQPRRRQLPRPSWQRFFLNLDEQYLQRELRISNESGDAHKLVENVEDTAALRRYGGWLSTVVPSRSSRTIHFCVGIGCTRRTV